jgi:uncharacterized membrane protein
MYLRQLKKKLRFKFDKDDIDSILNDYNEIFDVETAQGKTEKDVCMSLGNPTIIVQNLYKEMHSKDALAKNIFLRGDIVRSISFAMICLIIAKAIYSLNYGHGGSMMVELLIFYPVLVSLLWLVLQRSNRVSTTAIIKNSLMQIKVAHLICLLIVLSLFFVCNNIIVNFRNDKIGNLVVGFLYIFIALLCGMILFGIFKFKRNQIAFYGVVCHALGVLVIILYYINVLHSLTNVNLFSIEIMKSGLIYLETIMVTCIFYIFTYKGKKQKWMHN